MRETLNTLSLFFLLSLIWGNYHNAHSQCATQNRAFTAGEVVKFSAYYNWNFIWVNAGEVTFTVDLKSYKNKPIYNLKAIGTTFKGYDFFYSVRDTFESFVDTTFLKPSYYMQSSNEGGFNSKQHYWYNDNLVTTKVMMEQEPEVERVIAINGCALDVLTMVYAVRNMKFDSFALNDKIPISLILDGKLEDLYVRYLGMEVVEDRSGRWFSCYKFSPNLPKNAIFSGGEQMVVWVTADENRLPIVVEAKILIGSVKAVFLEAQNLKYPLNSRVR